MRISGMTDAKNNMQARDSGFNMQMDSISRNIQNQIAVAEKQLQELSSNDNIELEEKMKKRQELQKEITGLKQQLRQHQMEQRKAQKPKETSTEDMLSCNQKNGNRRSGAGKSAKKGSGLSQANMQTMISADSTMKQAQVQDSVATKMERRAGVLESEIKQDANGGSSVEKKEEELADVQQKSEKVVAGQISTLASVNQVIKDGKDAERLAENDENKGERAKENGKKINRESEDMMEHIQDNGQKERSAILENSVPEVSQVVYTSVDIRL